MNNKSKYRSIDLFAGIGGIRLGFDRAFKDEIETVFVSEWDEKAQETYRANFDDDFEIAGDITKIDESQIPEFDICLAGFPCQAFSMAGRKQGFDDDYKGTCRGTLFLDVARICDYHKPKVIFCENVKGLTIHDRGRTYKIIRKTFEDLGYTVFDKILNSKEKYMLLLEKLKDIPEEKRNAYFTCALYMIYNFSHKEENVSATGICYGKILTSPIGEGGFGYDPVFFCNEANKPMALLGDNKNKYSHRALATRSLLKTLDIKLSKNS